ncbi:MAG: aminotransferase class V-fold PLP-dependent enzyme, partial [Acidimicrobiia bacterium]
MNLKPGFSRFGAADPDRLHFAAHSHHPWPDVSHDAHQRAWLDAVEMADDKWDHVFGTVIPETTDRIAARIGLDSGDTITFAPNTHEFLVRLFSCFEPPVRVLSTGSEFHSFTRQSHRWEEEGLAVVDRVPTEPFETFPERFAAEVASAAHDLIYVSAVFYDSAWVVPDMERIVAELPDERPFFVIDGYHAFMAMPVDITTIADRVFFIAGGYKYAMSGEGVCFMHCPPGYGPRPVDTGWYAGFGQLETGVTSVSYAENGSRFAGATFDVSGVYRMNAVLEWLESEGVDTKSIHSHALDLQEHFLDSAPELGRLVVDDSVRRANFVAIETPDAGELYQGLHDHKVITDYR